MSVRTGICGAKTITTIICMDVHVGLGVDIGGSASTATVCEPCTATIRVIGGGFDLTGICGEGTIITRDLVGSGDDTARLDVTCIDCAS